MFRDMVGVSSFSEKIGPEMLVDILHKRVWLWDGEEPHAHCWHLLIRREVKNKKTKYSLSNASEDTKLKRLAFMQAQRYWTERIFQDAKNQCGLGEYQAQNGAAGTTTWPW